MKRSLSCGATRMRPVTTIIDPQRTGAGTQTHEDYASTIERSEVTFPSGDAHCAAWLYEPAAAPSCCVVMAHGFSLTRHDGLPPYAERLAAAGAGALLFCRAPLRGSR